MFFLFFLSLGICFSKGVELDTSLLNRPNGIDKLDMLSKGVLLMYMFEIIS